MHSMPLYLPSRHSDNLHLEYPMYPTSLMALALLKAEQQQQQQQQQQQPITPKITKPSRKRVRFGSSPQVRSVPRHPDHAAVWWDDHALEKRRRTDKVHVKRNSIDANPEYHQNIRMLRKSYKNATRRDLLPRITQIARSDVRGLEPRIVPILKLYRAESVRAIVAAQDGVGPEDLRQQSLQLSRCARQLAFRLAQADRLEAREIYGEKTTTTSCGTTEQTR